MLHWILGIWESIHNFYFLPCQLYIFIHAYKLVIGNIVHKTYSGWLLSEKNDWDIGSCLFVLVKQISANDFAEISKAGIY